MNTVKLERQIRLIPLIFIIIMLFLKSEAIESSNPLWLYAAVLFGVLGFSFFIFRIYLEKKNGKFVAKRYYLISFLMALAAVFFLYSLFQT